MFEPSQKAMFHLFWEPSHEFSKMPLIQFQNPFPFWKSKLESRIFQGVHLVVNLLSLTSGVFFGEKVRRLPLFCHPSFLKDHSQCHNANFVWKFWSELPQSDDAIGPQTMINESYWRQNMGV